MIIVKLIGGLGNQMFQYALGKKMALLNDDKLLLDCSFFEEVGSHTPREFELDVFNVAEKRATEADLSLFRKVNRGRLKSAFSKLFPTQSSYHIIKEQGHHFQPTVLDARGDVMLVGYWQSEKYFADIRPDLQKAFQFCKDLSAINLKVLEQISACEAVSIHIRRGDYVSNTSANSFHGLCDLDYYHRAIALMHGKKSEISFFIFSDDIEWAKENLVLNSPAYFIDHNTGKSSFEDLRLMSLCKHNIIANSSFSWWGAWLNPNQDKIVIGPRMWFLDPSINTQDVLPESWIKL